MRQAWLRPRGLARGLALALSPRGGPGSAVSGHAAAHAPRQGLPPQSTRGASGEMLTTHRQGVDDKATPSSSW